MQVPIGFRIKAKKLGRGWWCTARCQGISVAVLRDTPIGVTGELIAKWLEAARKAEANAARL